MVLLSGPNIVGNEWKYVKDCLDTAWISSVGSYVSDFENSISNYVGSKYAIATSSGTSALHLSLLLSDVKPNDLVLVTNVTFIATLKSTGKIIKAIVPDFMHIETGKNLNQKM